MFEIAYITNKGARSQNEDRIFINGKIFDNADGYEKSDNCFLAVCDGVGGENFGEEAAMSACEAFVSFVNEDPSEELAYDYVVKANECIRELQSIDSSHKSASSTVAALCIKDNRLLVFNLGDSEVIQFRMGMMITLSEKHTLINEINCFGGETDNINPHVITKFLGRDCFVPYVFMDKEYGQLDDIFLLFSDGIGDAVSKREMKEILRTGNALSDIAEKICSIAVKNGTTDNLSLIIVRRL